jgi:chaperonin cofactor prefoldin
MSMTQNTMQNKSLEYTMNQAMEKLNQLCKNFAVLHNEQQSIKNEITSIKVKFNTKDTSKPNTTVNKSIGSKFIGVTKGHNKRILIEESSDDSSHELLDLEARYQQTEQKTQKMANDLTDLKTTMQHILQFFQQSTNDNQNVEGDDDSDVEIIDISQ